MGQKIFIIHNNGETTTITGDWARCEYSDVVFKSYDKNGQWVNVFPLCNVRSIEFIQEG